MRLWKAALSFKTAMCSTSVAVAAQDAPEQVITSPMPAYPIDDLCTGVAVKNYNFDASGPGVWFADERAVVREGFDIWQPSTKRMAGGPLFIIQESTQSPSLKVIRGVPSPVSNPDPLDVNGDNWNDWQSQANCGKMQIASKRDEPATMRNTALHEMGHSLGLRHSGRVDSRPKPPNEYGSGFWESANSGEAPVMNGNCSVAHNGVPKADDWASLTEAITPPMITADPGFESGALRNDIWRGNLTVETASPANGTRSISIPDEGVVAQRVRLYGWSTEGFRSRGNFRTNGSGGVNFKVFGRRMTYSSWPCGNSTYQDDWIAVQSYQTVDFDGAATWETATPGFSYWNSASYGNGYAIDLLLQIGNYSGAKTFLDNIRMERS